MIIERISVSLPFLRYIACRGRRSSSLVAIVAATAIAALYLLPGIFGHGPWKQDETYTFGIIDHFIKSGDWLIPTNAGQAFMEKPPLYMWVAAALARLFAPLLPLHDGARLASVLFGGAALWCAMLAARSAYTAPSWRDRRVIGVVALMAATLVVIKHVHDMFSDVALLAGTCLGLASLIHIVAKLSFPDTAATSASATKPEPEPIDSAAGLALRWYRWSALQRGIASLRIAPNTGPSIGLSASLGVGVGIAFLSKGVFVPAVFAVTTMVLPLVLRTCRSRAYVKAIGVALLISLPFLSIWPMLLYRASPTLFMTWFWDNNIGRFIGFSVAELGSDNEPWFMLKAVLTSGFPVGPLAIIGLIFGGWRRLREPHMAVSLLFCGFGIGVLSLSATARQLYLLPFALPGALLAADVIPRLPQVLSTIWDGLNRLLFTLLAITVWIGWWIMRQPVEQHDWLNFVSPWLPLDYQLPLQPIALAVALMLTSAWLIALPKISSQQRWRGPLSWAAGLSLIWGLAFTLLLPWIDRAKSYETVFLSLHRQLQMDQGTNGPANKQMDGQTEECMSSLALGESEAPMLYYYAGILHRPIAAKSGDASTSCRWLIVQGKENRLPMEHYQWLPYWEGARQGDLNELLTVYRRQDRWTELPPPKQP